MNANEVQDLLMENFRKMSGHEHREYLGMSGIGRCPRELYLKFTDPPPPNDRLTWYGMVGYALEAKVVERLQEANGNEVAVTNWLKGPHDVEVVRWLERTTELEVLQVTRELVAEFDDRYRGHTDHELADGTLIEIKSINWKGYCRVWYAGKPKRDHMAQCQAYMRHGCYDRCVIIYTPRDIPHREWENQHQAPISLPFLTLDITPNSVLQDQLDEKAKQILWAIDNHSMPPCLCGYCKR